LAQIALDVQDTLRAILESFIWHGVVQTGSKFKQPKPPKSVSQLIEHIDSDS